MSACRFTVFLLALLHNHCYSLRLMKGVTVVMHSTHALLQHRTLLLLDILPQVSLPDGLSGCHVLCLGK